MVKRVKIRQSYFVALFCVRVLSNFPPKLLITLSFIVELISQSLWNQFGILWHRVPDWWGLATFGCFYYVDKESIWNLIKCWISSDKSFFFFRCRGRKKPLKHNRKSTRNISQSQAWQSETKWSELKLPKLKNSLMSNKKAETFFIIHFIVFLHSFLTASEFF